MTGKEIKSQQRKQGISGRKGLLPELAEQYSKAIVEKLLTLERYKSARTIMSYQPFSGEVDVNFFNKIAESDGKRVAYPITEQCGLVPAIPQGEDAWETAGKYGIRTPVRKNSIIVAPEEIDLVIVPCTAFSAVTRIRVGMGAGYYDCFLPKCTSAETVAVAFEVQRIDDAWADTWDVSLDAIVTECAVYG